MSDATTRTQNAPCHANACGCSKPEAKPAAQESAGCCCGANCPCSPRCECSPGCHAD